MNEKKKRRVRPAAIILPFIPVIAGLCALMIGRYSVTPADLWHSVVGHLTGGSLPSGFVESTLWHVRLPRILLAMLAGAGLSAAGCSFQSLFSNPLATPDTLGVASGASFGAALGMLCGMKLVGIQLFALGFGILAILLTTLTGSGRAGRGLSGTVLAGIMIGSLFNALVSWAKLTADTESELPAITYWLMGNLGSAGYGELLLGAPPILIGLTVLLLLRWRMNLLPLSEDEARAAGVNLKLLRGTVIGCAAVMTASVVSMCGQVGWVGLLVPHICRMKWGSNQLSLLPASVFIGAGFLTVVDTAARSMTASDLPVSILTAVIGAPFFIYLMRRTEGWRL
ncbi:MAG: iron ABC transporter permease [Clostridia bacterium]|nr:iron ABC transporter permease [Clostridia bacterium]